MQLTGIHHLTAVTSNAPANHAFYTQTLGLRLVKKTVNQDDVTAYHLFYADGRGSPGTDITFFDWPVKPEQRGTHSISRTGMRVAGVDTIAWWKRRFQDLGVTHSDVVERDGRLDWCGSTEEMTMEFILRLQCDDVLGVKIERETPTGLVTIATAAPQGESLEVHLLDSPANAGLEFLDGLRARDCGDLRRKLARPNITVVMPDV
jgi:catechol 2,3-dioxygenase-like lactoylglutathione lyase family enzyme